MICLVFVGINTDCQRSESSCFCFRFAFFGIYAAGYSSAVDAGDYIILTGVAEVEKTVGGADVLPGFVVELVGFVSGNKQIKFIGGSVVPIIIQGHCEHGVTFSGISCEFDVGEMIGDTRHGAFAEHIGKRSFDNLTNVENVIGYVAFIVNDLYLKYTVAGAAIELNATQTVFAGIEYVAPFIGGLAHADDLVNIPKTTYVIEEDKGLGRLIVDASAVGPVAEIVFIGIVIVGFAIAVLDAAVNAGDTAENNLAGSTLAGLSGNKAGVGLD